MSDVNVLSESSALSYRTSAAGPAASDSYTASLRQARRPYPKRSLKACVECRSKKQRCTGPSSIPCERCAAAGRSCSFENDYVGVDDGNRPVAFSVQVLLDMQTELHYQRERIENLEALLGAAPPASEASHDAGLDDGHNGFAAHQDVMQDNYADQEDSHRNAYSTQGTSHTQTQEPEAAFDRGVVSLHGINMDAPAVFLRSMDSRVRGDAPTSALHSSQPNGIAGVRSQTCVGNKDPVKLGIMDMTEAQSLFDTFWAHCAPLCIVLCREGQRHAFQVSKTSPLLFTVVLSVAARFWNTSNPNASILHPTYWQIVDLVDKQLSEMLLRPQASGFTLETIQALLLYCQYSPLQSFDETGYTARTRFSDSRAWLVISLALRLAKVLRLGQRASDFPLQPARVTQDDMKHMRAWISLLSVDHLLSLSTNLVPSLDPSPAARAVRDFAAHPLRQDADNRASGMYEVIAIVHRLASFGMDQPLAQIGTGTLRRANEELNEWERRWMLSAEATSPDTLDPQFTFPLTSLRWYRIALNSASAGAYASANQANEEYLRLQGASLAVALDAAAQMLWRFALESVSDVTGRGWQAHSAHPFTVNARRAKVLAYSVDSYWLTHSFAAALLAIAFDKGAVDSSLRLQSPPQVSSADPTSPLIRLLTLALALVDQVVGMALHHPATAYRPYFQAALHTCAPPAGSMATSLTGEDNSLESFLQLLASKDNINLGAFQDTVFTTEWDGSTWG